MAVCVNCVFLLILVFISLANNCSTHVAANPLELSAKAEAVPQLKNGHDAIHKKKIEFESESQLDTSGNSLLNSNGENDYPVLQRRGTFSIGGIEFSGLGSVINGGIFSSQNGMSVSTWTGGRVDMSNGDGLVIKAHNFKHHQGIMIKNNQVFVGGKLVCDDISKVASKPTYQKTSDGTYWYTNINVGEPMTKAEIDAFEEEWAQYEKELKQREAERKLREEERERRLKKQEEERERRLKQQEEEREMLFKKQEEQRERRLKLQEEERERQEKERERKLNENQKRLQETLAKEEAEREKRLKGNQERLDRRLRQQELEKNNRQGELENKIKKREAERQRREEERDRELREREEKWNRWGKKREEEATEKAREREDQERERRKEEIGNTNGREELKREKELKDTKRDLNEKEAEKEEVRTETEKEESRDEDDDDEDLTHFTIGSNSYMMNGKNLQLNNYKGVRLQVTSPNRKQSIIIKGGTVTVNGRAVCTDIRKLDKKQTYQITDDGAEWYTNLKVGKPMTEEEIEHFQLEEKERKVEEEKQRKRRGTKQERRRRKRERARRNREAEKEKSWENNEAAEKTPPREVKSAVDTRGRKRQSAEVNMTNPFRSDFMQGFMKDFNPFG